MLPFVKTNANNKILNQLIFANCLSFGRSPKLNNRRINHYIFGTRQKFDVFKLYEMRYLILKIYPIIHNLFLQERLNNQKKKKWFFNKDFDLQTKNLPFVFRQRENFNDLKDKFNRTMKKKIAQTLPPKILFATTTNLYSEIVISAAKKCRMPFHVNRWLSGSVTAASFWKNDKEKWSLLLNTAEEKYITSQFQKKFFQQKKNLELQRNKVQKAQANRKPTLIIIPDVANNEPILKETNAVGIPTLGLVNSHCNLEIAYPIFANDLSLYSVHFFCHFLSSLILKEFVKHKHKIHTSRANLRPVQFPQAIKDIFRFNKRNFSERFLSMKRHLQRSSRAIYKKKRQNQDLVRSKNTQRKIQILKNALRRTYKKKVFLLKSLVLKYFHTKSFRKKKNNFRKYNFKGKYYIEHFPKARRQIKKNLRNQKKFDEKSLLRKISPKKLISSENRKRLKKSRMDFYMKKKILSKIHLVNKLEAYNFPKILKALRLPENKPTFAYWNKRKFWFAKPIKFSASLPVWYIFQRYTLKNLMRRRFVKIRRKHNAKKTNFWKKSQNLLQKKKYRKRWSTKKLKKGHIKSK